MVYEAADMHASLLGFCHKSLILGDDLIGQSLRCVRGIEASQDSISLEVMRSVCQGGPEHYLGQDQTLRRMQTEYVYPEMGNRTSPREWIEQGKPDLISTVINRKNEILAQPPRARFDPVLDAKLREKFKIHLTADK